MSATPSGSTLLAIATAVADITTLISQLSVKNEALKASLAIHAASLKTAPEPGPPPPTSPPEK